MEFKEGNITKILMAIQREIGAIGKTDVNVQQHFNFRSIDAVYNDLHGLFAKYGVVWIPEVLSEEREERTSKSGGVLITRILRIQYTMLSEDGSYVTTIVRGEGMDSGDKAGNKAMSIAHKYAILQIFTIPTEEQKDPDFDFPEATTKAKRGEVISEAQRKRIFAIAHGKKISDEQVKEVCLKYGYYHSNEIKRSEYDKIVAEVEILEPIAEGEQGEIL